MSPIFELGGRSGKEFRAGSFVSKLQAVVEAPDFPRGGRAASERSEQARLPEALEGVA
jgi:hypothetical protein